MMKLRYAKFLLFTMALFPANLSASEDRFWIIWERIKFIGQHCPDGAQCLVQKSYASRPLEIENDSFIYRLFGVADGRPHREVFAAEHPDAPSICAPNQPSIVLGFDPEALPRSEKIEVLRGIKSVHVDLTGLRTPPGYAPSFGETLHRRFVQILEGGGIKVVGKEAVAGVPGQPSLNLYFSFSDPDDHCEYTYSVFASLSQDVLLARDLRIKVPAGVWSYSTGLSAKDHSGTEEDAILRVATALLRDHGLVNSR